MEDNTEDEHPPLFARWRSWYWLVLAVLAIQIICYYLLTRYYS